MVLSLKMSVNFLEFLCHLSNLRTATRVIIRMERSPVTVVGVMGSVLQSKTGDWMTVLVAVIHTCSRGGMNAHHHIPLRQCKLIQDLPVHPLGLRRRRPLGLRLRHPLGLRPGLPNVATLAHPSIPVPCACIPAHPLVLFCGGHPCITPPTHPHTLPTQDHPLFCSTAQGGPGFSMSQSQMRCSRKFLGIPTRACPITRTLSRLVDLEVLAPPLKV